MALDFTKHATLQHAFDYFKAAWAEYENNMTEANMNGAHLAWNRLQKMPTTCVNDVLLKLQAFMIYRDAPQTDWAFYPMPDDDMRLLQHLTIAAHTFAPTVVNSSAARRGPNLTKNCVNSLLTQQEHDYHRAKSREFRRAVGCLYAAAKAIVAQVSGLTVAKLSVQRGDEYDPGDAELVTISTDFENSDLAPFRMAGFVALSIFGAAPWLRSQFSKVDFEAAGQWADVGKQGAEILLREPWAWNAVLFTANLVYVHGELDGQHIPNIVNLHNGEITRQEFAEWEALTGLDMNAAQ